MAYSKKTKMLLGLGAIVVVLGVATPWTVISVYRSNSVKLTLLDNAGVMIETQGLRIYIDPINLNETYEGKPADGILITHDHGDHYQPEVIEMLQKEGTINVFPEIMDSAITLFGGIAVNPGDSLLVGTINVSTFYMYTPDSHPQSANYTSFIIDIDGFTIFHAGDSYNIVEYAQLTDKIDVAMLPLGPGCQTMAGYDIITVLNTINPDYFIPIHYAEGADETFLTTYATQLSDFEVVHLSYFSDHRFWI